MIKHCSVTLHASACAFSDIARRAIERNAARRGGRADTEKPCAAAPKSVLSENIRDSAQLIRWKYAISQRIVAPRTLRDRVTSMACVDQHEVRMQRGAMPAYDGLRAMRAI